MKKLICLYSVTFHNSLLGQRFIFDTPEKQEVAAPVEAGQKPTFKEYLTQLEASKGDPETMATTLENTLQQLEAEYAGRGQERVEDGRRRLVDMCSALDITGPEKKALLDDYESTFKSNETTEVTTATWWGLGKKTETVTTEYNAKDREMKEASDKDVADHFSALQDSAMQELALVDQHVQAADARYVEAESNLALYDQSIVTAEDQEDERLQEIDDTESALTEMAQRFQLDVTDPEALIGYLADESQDHKLSLMVKEGFFKQDPITAADDEHLGKLDGRVTARLTRLAQAVDAVNAAREAHLAAQEHTQDLREDREPLQTELDAAAAEHQTTYEEYAAKKKQIEDGTYKLAGDKETIQSRAEREAANSVSPEEQAIIDKYAQLAAEKTTTLMRRAAFKKLDGVGQSLEGKIAATQGDIDQRMAALKENTQEALTVLKQWETDRGITKEMSLDLNQTYYQSPEWREAALAVVKPLVAAKYASSAEDYMPTEEGNAERQAFLREREESWVGQYEKQLRLYHDVHDQETKDTTLATLQDDLSQQQTALTTVKTLKERYAKA